MQATDTQATRCGHNYLPHSCPYARCGYREALAAISLYLHGDSAQAETAFRALTRVEWTPCEGCGNPMRPESTQCNCCHRNR
jgi:hypothetical protein